MDVRLNKETFLTRYNYYGHPLTGNEKTSPAIRVNTLKTRPEKLLETLTQQNVQLTKIPYLDHGYQIKETPFSLGANMEYLLGHYSLQRTAPQYPVQLLRPTSKDTVLDMCAAPGGKTTQMAADMNNQGTLIAVDISQNRVYALENNLERCGVTNCSVYHGDVTQLKFNIRFDKILLDAPCTGNYVTDPNWFRKRTMKDVTRNAGRQKELLTAALDLLTVDGILLYATCSLEPEENELNIQWLLENHPVQLEKIEGPGSPALTTLFGQELDPTITNCRRFWPDETGTQGFFAAKVVKQ